MQLKKMDLVDYEEVVDMLYAFYQEVYGDIRQLGSRYFYYQTVSDWINKGKDVVLSIDKGIVTGFSLAYVDSMGGLTKPYYNGEIAYVKPKYRKGRSAYLLYKNVVEYADELNMNLLSNSRVENGVDKMVEKHFDCKKMFINYERIYNG